MKRTISVWLLPAAFVIWVFFVLASFFAVQKPFTLDNVELVADKLLRLSLLDGIALAALGVGLLLLHRRRPTEAPATKLPWFVMIIVGLLIVLIPFSVVNPLAVGNGLLDLLTAGWLALTTLGLGIWFLQRLRRLELSLLETVIFGMSLGLGALGLLSLVLGLVGLFQAATVYIVTITLSALAVPQFKTLWRSKPSSQVWSGPGLAATVYLLLVSLCTVLVALLPPTDWDGLFYHLTGPKLYVQSGGLVGGIDIPHLSFPLLMEMLFAWAILLRGDIAAKLLHTLFAFLLAGLVYLTAYRLLSKKSAWFAVLIYASMPMVSTLAGWAYNDLALAFYQLAGLYAFIKWRLVAGDSSLESQDIRLKSWSWLILSGIFAGLAMGMKYTSFVTPLIISGLIVWSGYRRMRPKSHPPQTASNLLRTRHYGSHITSLAIFCFTTLLVALPWYAKNWFFSGNPVYPFLYGLFGGHYWDNFRAAWYAAAGTGIGFQPGTLLALPWLLTLGVRDMNYWDGRTGPLLLLFLPLALLYGLFRYRRRDPDRPFALDPLLIYALVHFFVWTVGVIWSRALWQSRLLLPGLVALAPVAGWLWSDLARFDRPHFSLRRFANIAVALTLTLIMVDIGLLTIKIDPVRYLAGMETRDQYLARRLGAYYDTMQQINNTLPAESKIVFLWEPRSYYCRRHCLPDSILDTFPHLVNKHGTAATIARSWHDTGVTHVLVHRAGLAYVLNETPEVVNQAVLARLEDEYWQKVFDMPGAYQLYALRPVP